MVTNRHIGGGNDQVGTIIQYFGSNPPKGFLSCDGSIYNIVDYSRLANHIEIEFGSKNFFGGDGTTTFAVPDLRGEFLRGTGTNGATEISGSNVGYHQDATRHNFSRVGGAGDNRVMWLEGQYSTPNADSGLTASIQTKVVSATSQANTVYYVYTSRPTNTSVLFCIRW